MLKIVQTDLGVFDLAFDDPALNDEDAAVATLVYVAFFTDAEAPVDREPDRYNRRGWWADPAKGSGLWHVRRQPRRL
jgi:phage gp46-like protein